MLALNGNLYVAPADILYYPYSGLTATTSARIVANSLERGSGFFHYNGHGGENGLFRIGVIGDQDGGGSNVQDVVRITLEILHPGLQLPQRGGREGV